MELQNRSIMLIDDNEFTLSIVGKALERNGFPTRKYCNPLKAVTEYDPEQIALVVTDYLMPAMNGLEVLTKIRKKDLTADVIVYSGVPNEKMIEQVKANNAYYFDKPLNFELLINEVQNIYAKTKEEKCLKEV